MCLLRCYFGYYRIQKKQNVDDYTCKDGFQQIQQLIQLKETNELTCC